MELLRQGEFLDAGVVAGARAGEKPSLTVGQKTGEGEFIDLSGACFGCIIARESGGGAIDVFSFRAG
jgi:hypothetical protein